jgi:hypothetical protein
MEAVPTDSRKYFLVGVESIYICCDVLYHKRSPASATQYMLLQEKGTRENSTVDTVSRYRYRRQRQRQCRMGTYQVTLQQARE